MLVDFFIQLFISIVFYYYGFVVNDFIYIYRKKTMFITNYFINNYNKYNMDIWKKKLILSINCYLILILWSINITSNILILYSIQYMFYLLILDYINNKKWVPLYKNKTFYNYPKSIIYDKIIINDDYKFKNK